MVALAAWVTGPASAQGSDQGSEAGVVDRGGEIYQAECAACHGTRGEGGSGTGVSAGPPLSGIELPYIDMTVRTGRMPIHEPRLGVYSKKLADDEREALIAYASEFLDTTGEIPSVADGDASRGQEMYVRNCAACHGAAADGGISGGSVVVPPLLEVDGVAIAEAARVGPFEMPAFDPAVLSDEDLADIVDYLDEVKSAPRSVVGLHEVDAATGGLLAIGLAAIASVVLFLVARARRWYRHEPGAYHETPPFEPRQ